MRLCRLFKFSILIRFLILLLQLIFNLIVPDHNADAFRLPHEAEFGSTNKIVSKSLLGLSRWDAQYFLHIALYGYTHENTLAFFPLFPFILRFTTTLVSFFLSSVLSSLNCALVAGALLNSILTSLSCIFLYKHAISVFQSEMFACIVALLFCLNPASVFFSVLYSEALFSLLTFSGLWALECGKYWMAVCMLSISALVRSNGILSAGFIAYAMLKEYIKNRYKLYHFSSRMQFFLLLQTMTKIIAYLLIFLVPFAMYQIYCYALFCTDLIPESYLPEIVDNYIMRNDLKTPSDPSRWCSRKIPLAYTYVQSRYWDIGFLQYFSLKQIPNFMLATPITLIMICSSMKYFVRHKRSFWHAGLLTYQYDNVSDMYNSSRCFPYFIHGIAVTLFCGFFIHVQVMTRILCSSSPLLYWVAATALLPTDDCSKLKLIKKYSRNMWLKDFLCLLKKLFMLSPLYGKIIFCYFITYFAVGIFLHVNFFPWT